MLHQALRNQYVLTYQPSNTKHDGAFRKLKVELVNPATNEPLPVKDEKGKPIKYRSSPRPATKRRARSNSFASRAGSVRAEDAFVKNSISRLCKTMQIR